MPVAGVDNAHMLGCSACFQFAHAMHCLLILTSSLEGISPPAAPPLALRVG